MENLIENPFKKTEEDGDEKKKRPVIKSATDLQRLKLEKLMKNPDKPIIIPEQPREKDYMQTVPSFVRNVMGSSAGAGSGEFHVYRHLRRKEYARQKCIQAKSIREQLDEEYQMKLEKNKLEAEAKTAKKRAKRMKKKQRAKKPKSKQNEEQNDDEKDDNSSEDEDDDDDKGNQEDETVEPSEKESSDREVQEDEQNEDVPGEEAQEAKKDDSQEATADVPAKELVTDDSVERDSANCEKTNDSTSAETQEENVEVPPE